MRAAIAGFSFLLSVTFPSQSFAADADPVALRYWLCTFFSAPASQRPALLETAPLPFAQAPRLVHSTRASDGDYDYVVSIWEIRSRWRIAYQFQTEPRDDAAFGHELTISRAGRDAFLLDEPSVVTFFRGYPTGSFDSTRALYELDIGANPPLSPDFSVAFRLRSQELRIEWRDEDHAHHGRAFCT